MSFRFGTALCASLALAAATQDPPLPPHPGELGGADAAAQEARALFAQVERTLRAIDLYLSDAAAGEVPLALPEESGLADLLRNTQEQSRNVVRDMNRLMQLAERQPGSSGGGGQNSPEPPPGNQPPREQGLQEPEPTPELPGQEPRGSEPAPAQPDGGDARDEDLENHANRPPAEGQQDPPLDPRDEGERWGELPPRVREVFRSQGGGDLPVQYRDWIDSYYRRLYRRP